VRFDVPESLLLFLPGLLALYFLIVAVGSLPWRKAGRVSHIGTTLLLLVASVAFASEAGFADLLLGLGGLSYTMAAVIAWLQDKKAPRLMVQAILGVALVAVLGVSVVTHLELEGRMLAPPVGSVVAYLAIAYLVDVYRRQATTNDPLSAVLYIVQLPVLVAGPIVRYREFASQLTRRTVSLGAFTYGTRRIVLGLVKVIVFARLLAGPADAIFARSPESLSTDAAWLGAACFSLQLYFLFSGYADFAIGLGRIVGFRYPENFRRPYTADSVREFWRRWNITLMTWLRDYLYLPIAGRDDPTPRLSANIVLGFCLVGLWHGAGWTVLVWAVYSGFWLAMEAVGLEARIQRLPSVLKHAYLLCVVGVGWAILRADTVRAALLFLRAMVGLASLSALTAQDYMTPLLWVVLAAAVLFAGPLVPWISRWRVSVDAAVVAALMMVMATAIFVWIGCILVANSLRPSRFGR